MGFVDLVACEVYNSVTGNERLHGCEMEERPQKLWSRHELCSEYVQPTYSRFTASSTHLPNALLIIPVNQLPLASLCCPAL